MGKRFSEWARVYLATDGRIYDWRSELRDGQALRLATADELARFDATPREWIITRVTIWAL